MGSIPAPKAAHKGSSTRHTERAPAWIITDTMVRFSTSVCMAGTDTTSRGLNRLLPITLLIKWRIICWASS